RQQMRRTQARRAERRLLPAWLRRYPVRQRLQHRGKEKLLELIEQHLPAESSDEAPQAVAALKLAIVGKRNTGKSTFINCLAQGERTIVSEVEGTTRDSIDVRFVKDSKTILAI